MSNKPAAVTASVVSKTVTTTYPDGRQVTETHYAPTIGDTAEDSTKASVSQSSPVAFRTDLGSEAANITCQFCSQNTGTTVVKEFGVCTWVSFGVLLLFFFPLFWLPFCCSDCKDSKHYCTKCGRQVGRSDAECCKK